MAGAAGGLAGGAGHGGPARPSGPAGVFHVKQGGTVKKKLLAAAALVAIGWGWGWYTHTPDHRVHPGTAVCHSTTEDGTISDCDYRDGTWYTK